MLIAIDMESEVPIYIQLRNQLIEGIATNQLEEGETLPSVRQLSADIGINLHTVNKVYSLLKQEGFLTIHRKSGVVVSAKATYQATDIYYKGLREDLRPLIAEAKCRGIDASEFLALCQELYGEMQHKH